MLTNSSFPPCIAIVAMDDCQGIGKDGKLPWHISSDLQRFSRITKGNYPLQNMVVMGRKTWESLPQNSRPLPSRVNVILTSQPERAMLKGDISRQTLTYWVLHVQRVWELATQLTISSIYIIGGRRVYETFAPFVRYAYVTHVEGNFDCDIFFPHCHYQHKRIVETTKYDGYHYEVWQFEPMLHPDRQAQVISNPHDETYLNLLRQVFEKGEQRLDRTGTGTISLFAPTALRFDISETVPLLTTKKVGWKTIIKELLWFLRGDTDAKILQGEGVHIWDGNSSREFLDSRNLSYAEGVIGPSYGWQFRRFGAKYDERYADTRNIDRETANRLGGFDQLMYVERLLKTDPESRRIYINLWNANDLDKMALPPCHVGINFYVSEKTHLSCHVYIRSNDLFLGNPYNIFSYTVLTYILSKRCNLKPKELVVSLGDAHIYKNHLSQVKEQLQRDSYTAPILEVADRVATVNYHEINIDDFHVVNYQCHSALKANMSA
jgi:thymidylate synthase